MAPDSNQDRAAALARHRRRRRRTGTFVFLIAAGLLLVLGVLNLYTRTAAVMPYTGVEWAGSPDGIRAVRVEAGSPAGAAGLRAGDLMVAIDGEIGISSRHAREAPWRLVPGESLLLTVNRLGRVFQVDLKPVWRDSGSPLYAYKVFVGLFFLASGMWLMYRLGPERLIIRYFLLTMAAFAFFGFSHTGEGGFLDLVFLSLDMGGRLMFPAILLHLALSFPAGGRLSRRTRILVYGPVLLTAGTVVWLGPLGGAVRLPDPVRALELAGASELLAGGIYLTTAFMVLAIRSTRSTLPSDHRQLRWMAWGTGIGSLPYVILYLIPQGLGVETPVAADLSMLLMILIPLSFSTAILRYRLADLGLFVKNGITALILTLFSLALFLLVNTVLRLILGLPGIDQRVFTILAAVFVFLLYPHLRRVVGEGVDRAFYLGHYDYRRTLQEFARELNSERELLPLTIRFHDRIQQTLPVSSSVLLLPENGGLRLLDRSCPLGEEEDADLIPQQHPLVASLEENDFVHVDRGGYRTLPQRVRGLGLQSFFPMRVKGRLVAVLAVAPKVAGEEMNSEDRQLLVTLAAHAASSIEGARLYEENRARIREVGQLKDYNESIVESSRVGILVLDGNQLIRGWNRTMGDLFGHDRDHVRGKPAADYFPVDFVALLHSMPPAGRRVDRFALPAPGRPRRLFNLALAEMRGAQGGFVVTFDEVTEQVRIEEQLVQSERLAAVGLLASGVAHEINTPLTGIASYAQMLLEDLDEDDPAREYLERIRKQSWRASHIANSLLNFSRGSGNAFTKVDLNAIVDETLALFGPQIKGRRIDIQFTPSPDPPLVEGHQGRLQQVLLNLLLNARDALAGGGEIRIRTAVNDDHVKLQVEDTGEGISREDLKRIYDPFFTTKGAGGGTGLGLSVTYGIVQDHHGSLSARSRPGEGTVFSLDLPAWQEIKAKQASA